MSPECPACQRRLSLRAGNEETFKSSCPWDGCGAELLCVVENGAFTVNGPTAMRQEEAARELAVPDRARSAAMGTTARAVMFGVVVGLVAFYAGLYFFPKDGGAPMLLVFMLYWAFWSVGSGGVFWLVARRRTPREIALRAVEGALEAVPEPAAYR